MKFSSYLIENREIPSNVGEIKASLERYLGSLGLFSLTPNKIISSKGSYYVQFIVRKNPKKSVRIYFTKDFQPTRAFIWTNFGFHNFGQKLNPPDHSIPYSTREQFINNIVHTLKKSLEEGYSDLSTYDRKRWKELRKRVKEVARRGGTSKAEINYLWVQAKTLGVAKSTFGLWMYGSDSHVSAPKPKQAPAFKPAKLTRTTASKPSTEGHRSAVQIMRQRGLSDSEIVSRIDDAVETHTKVLKRGEGTSLLVTGKGGTGKTTIVTNTLGRENKGKTWESFEGKVSPFSLYTFLFRNRHGKILVFDDTDVFRDEAMIDMLKSALDSKPHRVVGWMAHGRTVTKPSDVNMDTFMNNKEDELEELTSSGEEHEWKPPSQFHFTSKVIFITNKSMEGLLKNPHTNALASRALARVDYDFDDNLMLKKIQMKWRSIRPDVPEKEREKILNAIDSSVREGTLSNVSLRTFGNAVGMLSAGVEVSKIKQMMEDGNI